MKPVIKAVAVILSLTALNTYAAVFKCVGADGKQSYQQQPCPKTATESKVAVDADWTLVKYDTYFGGAPKDVGAYRRVMFKQSNSGDNAGARPSLGYVYYDCAKKSIAGPHYRMSYGNERKLELGKVEDSLFAGNGQFNSFENYKRPNDHRNPWGESEFVAFACADTAPAVAISTPTNSGPAAGVYAAKPEGIEIGDVSFTGDRVVVRGTAKSNANVSKFLRNLESAGYANPALTTINNDGFELSAQNK